MTLLIGVTVKAQPILTLNAPLEKQVCQRDEQNQARVPIAGTVQGGAEVIEAKAELTPAATRGEAVGWTVIARDNDMADGTFTGQLVLKAGGWYRLTVRARRGTEILGEAAVNQVGVGEVFITAGQSNSANFGKPRLAAKDGRVVYFDGEHFVPAQDPIPGGCGGGGSVWPIVGDLVAGSQEVPVCFRSATLTWTSSSKWMPGVEHFGFKLYENLVACAKAFPKHGVRAVLWHQGESDSVAGSTAEAYFQRLQTIIESLNQDAGYEIPWFVAQASFYPHTKKAEENEVARGQQLLWSKGIAHKGPVTDDLGDEYRYDGVHFNEKGLITHGQRWFKALAAQYRWQVKDPATQP
jgi:hypothetical protein